MRQSGSDRGSDGKGERAADKRLILELLQDRSLSRVSAFMELRPAPATASPISPVECVTCRQV